MNFAKLERMVVEGDMSKDALIYLLHCKTECEWLDYKQDFHLEHESQLCDFAKDAIALKNVGGGFLVIGVRDKTWEPIGIKFQIPYDSKQLQDKVLKCTGITIDIFIANHDVVLRKGKTTFGLIYVRASKKRTKRHSPSLTKKSYQPTLPYGIRQGEIYIRENDQTIRAKSLESVSEIIDRLSDLSDSDSIESEQTSPFAIIYNTYRLLEKGFDTYIGRNTLRENILKAVSKDPRIWIINVHGPGGVGKSALVNWVTYEFYEEKVFEAIIQLTAKETYLSPTGIKRLLGRSLYSLENLLDQILRAFHEIPPTPLDNKVKLVVEYLSAYKTLLVLDNMETVSDGRILDFIQKLPPESQAKVLITSRTRTGGWELPIYVKELDKGEIYDFIKIKSEEMNVDFPLDEITISNVERVTGGLPLAIQWLIGKFKLSGDIKKELDSVLSPDSPVLEFSFRNIWGKLSSDSQAVLAIMSIFENRPPEIELLSVALGWPKDRIERALEELIVVTFVAKTIQEPIGNVIYTALPITLSFAQYQLGEMGDFETKCRQRYQIYNNQLELKEYETQKFDNIFLEYGLQSENERKAAVLCKRGQSEFFGGNVEVADELFKQAKEMAPSSAYIFAMSASNHLARNRLGAALKDATESCRKSTKKTGSLCYTIKARVLKIQKDFNGVVEAFKAALEFNPSDVFVRHQYGVALSKAKQTEEAIRQFTIIIDEEKNKSIPQETLLIALKTRIHNFKRLGKHIDAQSDIDLATDILKNYPHLQNLAWRFAEYEDNQ